MFWAVPAVGGAALGGARWAQRVVPLLDGLSEPPAASIPQAGGTWAQTQAAYRFCDHPRVTSDAMLALHRQQTVRRGVESPVLSLKPLFYDGQACGPVPKMKPCGMVSPCGGGFQGV